MLRRVDTLNSQREQQAKESGQRFIPIKVGRRHQYRPLRRGKHGLGSAVQLFRPRRSRKSGIPAGGAIEELRPADHSRITHGVGSRRQVRGVGARLHHRQRQDRTGSRSIQFSAAADVAGSDRFGQLRRRTSTTCSRAFASKTFPVQRKQLNAAASSRWLRSEPPFRHLCRAHSRIRAKPTARRLEWGFRAGNKVATTPRGSSALRSTNSAFTIVTSTEQRPTATRIRKCRRTGKKRIINLLSTVVSIPTCIKGLAPSRTITGPADRHRIC